MTDARDNLICDKVSDRIIEVAERIVQKEGTSNVTVRKILREMGVTNRVFYNRFRNIAEVLEIIYKRAVLKMRESLRSDYDVKTDFYNHVMDLAVKVLISTYDIKEQFSNYSFEFDSKTDENRLWWSEKIKRLIEIAKETKQIKNVDSDMLSYTLWCFFRGYNADVVHRHLSKEEAVKNFKYSIECLFEGVKA